MKIVATPACVNDLKASLTPSIRWCYIGKNVSIRDKVGKALGDDKRFYLRDRLSITAENLKRPFLDLMAKAAEKQKDPLNWWASRFSSRSPFQTDFFLLLCYKKLIFGLVDEIDDLIIIIEDPWLYMDVRGSVLPKDMRFFGGNGLTLSRFLCFSKGIYSRGRLFFWFLRARLLMLYYFRIKVNGMGGTKVSGPAVGILTYAEKHAFKDGKFVDNYMTGLSDALKKNKIPYFYMYTFPFSLSIAKMAARDRSILRPIVMDIGLAAAIRSFFKIWRPRLTDLELDGLKLSLLVQRERWIEFSSIEFNVNLMIFDALDNFFRKKQCNSIIYIFENQPWEKMACMAAAKNNIKTTGYQHSSLSKLYVSQFLGDGENVLMPLPDHLITTGRYFSELFEAGGINREKIVVGGARRFTHILERAQCHKDFEKKSSAKLTILVALSVDASISRSMFEQVLALDNKYDFAKEAEILIKSHPDTPLNKIGVDERKLPAHYHVTKKPFGELLESFDIVIETTSTVGIESFLCGKRVVLYIPDNLIVVDPVLDISSERVHRLYEGDSIDMNFIKDERLTKRIEPSEIRRYFDDVNDEVWLNLIKA